MNENDREVDETVADDGTNVEDAAGNGLPAEAPDAVDPPEPAHGPISELRSEFDDLNDRHLRLAAEFTNFRRRAEQEALGTWARAQADLVKRFLDVLDDLQRVAQLDPADEATTVEQVVEGIDLVERKFVQCLQGAGVEVIDPGQGESFDPESMEAMMRVPAGDQEDDSVAQVFQKGYVLDGNLVRAARVSVFKAD